MTEAFYVECNDKEVLKLLTNLADKVHDTKKLMRILSHVMLTDVDDNFETEGVNITGQKWEAWSEPYEAYRNKIGRGGGRILSLEGELREGISKKATEDMAIVSADKEYAAIHNFGGDIRRAGRTVGQMPERKFMGFHDKLKREIMETILPPYSSLLVYQHCVLK